MSDGQPIAVPCQTGPDANARSSGSRNISEEVVKKLKLGKSFEKIFWAS